MNSRARTRRYAKGTKIGQRTKDETVEISFSSRTKEARQTKEIKNVLYPSFYPKELEI